MVRLDHVSLQGLAHELRLGPDVVALRLRRVELLLDVAQVFFNRQHIVQKYFVLPVDFKLAQALVEIIAAVRRGVQSGDVLRFLLRIGVFIPTLFQALNRLVSEAAFWQVEQRLLSRSRGDLDES